MPRSYVFEKRSGKAKGSPKGGAREVGEATGPTLKEALISKFGGERKSWKILKFCSREDTHSFVMGEMCVRNAIKVDFCVFGV